MIEILVPLLTAHLLGNFVFHSERMQSRPKADAGLGIHAATITALSLLCLGRAHLPLLALVFLTNWLINFINIKSGKTDAIAFLIDQAAHVLAALLLASYFTHIPLGSWPDLVPGELRPLFHDFQCIIGGFILAAPTGGIFIQKLTAPLRAEVETDLINDTGNGPPPEGLTNGGRYIGWLERILTLLLVLIGQPSAIGFVLAAKSILRFGEIKDTSRRRMAEYIIIGTFLSFGWAIAVSALVTAGLEYPPTPDLP